MSSEPLPKTPPAPEANDCGSTSEAGQIPLELSEFSQRLASFGLGESPDPLLTEVNPPGKRRSQG